tara:strand:- start:86 stop:430 length:345 start_codon:yes stop_codon:yes gene_type:complete
MISNYWSKIIKHKTFLLFIFFIISSCSINSNKELSYSNKYTIYGTILNITKVEIEEDNITNDKDKINHGVELLIQTTKGTSISIVQKIEKYNFVSGDKVMIIKSNNRSRVIPSE